MAEELWQSSAAALTKAQNQLLLLGRKNAHERVAAFLLEMAERIESRGATFYRKAAKIHVGARDLLMQIAEQEDMHFKSFEEMRKALTPSEKADDPYGEVEMYLSALVDDYDFDINQDPEKFFTGQESLDEIFRTAIGLEKDSIAFYLGLKELVPASMGGERIDAIVREEMKHIVWLSEKKKELLG